jgi:hypothetical protein
MGESYREGERKSQKCHMVDNTGEVSDQMICYIERIGHY